MFVNDDCLCTPFHARVRRRIVQNIHRPRRELHFPQPLIVRIRAREKKKLRLSWAFVPHIFGKYRAQPLCYCIADVPKFDATSKCLSPTMEAHFHFSPTSCILRARNNSFLPPLSCIRCCPTCTIQRDNGYFRLVSCAGFPGSHAPSFTVVCQSFCGRVYIGRSLFRPGHHPRFTCSKMAGRGGWILKIPC